MILPGSLIILFITHNRYDDCVYMKVGFIFVNLWLNNTRRGVDYWCGPDPRCRCGPCHPHGRGGLGNPKPGCPGGWERRGIMLIGGIQREQFCLKNTSKNQANPQVISDHWLLPMRRKNHTEICVKEIHKMQPRNVAESSSWCHMLE